MKRNILFIIIIGVCFVVLAEDETGTPKFTEYDDVIKAGDALFKAGKPGEAITVYEQALPLQKNADQLARVDLKIGRCLSQMKKYAAALERFDKVLARNGVKEITCAAAWMGKGHIYRKMKKVAEAKEYFKKVIASPGANADMKKRAQEIIDKK